MIRYCNTLMLFCLIMFSSAHAQWTQECIDCPRNFSGMMDRSLILDSAGNPHIAYGGDNLYYAWFDTTWHTEIADASIRVGRYAAISLDSSGYPHISYKDDLNDILKCAYKDVTGWHTEIVDSTESAGQGTSIAIDGAGHTHIAYLHQGQDALWYAYNDGSGWTNAPIDSAVTSPRSVSLLLDSSDYPHIAYARNFSGYGLSHAFKDGTGWHFEDVDTECYVTCVSIDLDTGGYIHISYQREMGLAYAYQDSGGWNLEIVDDGPFTNDGDSTSEINSVLRTPIPISTLTPTPTPSAGPYMSAGSSNTIRIDSEGYPHISYMKGWAFATHLNHVYKAPVGWQLHVLGGYFGVTGISLDLNASDYGHVSWLDTWTNRLVHQYQDADGWHSEDVDDLGVLQGNVPLTLDSGGYPHVVYVEENAMNLIYSYRDGGGWHRDVVDDSGIVYGYSFSDIELDAGDHVHISYYDHSNYDLKYAYFDGVIWTLETVDSTDSVGRNNSLDLDSSGYPHISYRDGTHSALKYAYKDIEGWHPETVAGYAYHNGTAIVLDSSDHVHLAYSDGDLRYAYNNGTGWTFEPIDEDLNPSTVFQSPSIDIDSSGYPHVSYVEPHDLLLKYAYRNGTGWQTEVISGTTGETEHPTLSLDPWDHAHICYAEVSSGLLYTVYGSPSNWSMEQLDNLGSGIHKNGIATDSNGAPHIGYHSENLGDVLYLKREPFPTPSPTLCIHHGDVDFNGVVTAGDSQSAFSIVMGTHIPTYSERCAADCDADGEVTAGDAQGIWNVVMGLGSCADPI